MSTLPDKSQFMEALSQLQHLTEAMASREDDADLACLSQFLSDRQSLLSWLTQADRGALQGEDEADLQQKVQEIQRLDETLVTRLEVQLLAKAKTLREMAQLRQALHAYKFPYVPNFRRVENQG